MDARHVIVTGGTKGIGYAVARRFIDDGARVVVADHDEKAGNAAAQALSERGAALFIATDVAERLTVRNLVAKARDAFGEIDLLVNNAGIAHEADFLDVTEADFDRVLNVNLKGAFLCGQAVARAMVERVKAGGPAGCIINMSSVDAVAIAGQASSCVSRGGLAQLTRVMALALAPHGIRVNAIGPGPMTAERPGFAAGERDAQGGARAGPNGDPEEIAGIAAFLASSDAACVTGQTVHVDGGWVAMNCAMP